MAPVTTKTSKLPKASATTAIALAALLALHITAATKSTQEDKQTSACSSAIYLLAASREVRNKIDTLARRQTSAMQELKSAILFAAAQNTDNSMRAQSAIPLSIAIRRLDEITNRLGNCITKGSDLQRKLATLAGLHLALTKITNLETTAVDEGTAHSTGAAENHKVYHATALTNFADTTCESTLEEAAKNSETGIDLTELKAIKTYKLQQTTTRPNPTHICGIKCTDGATCRDITSAVADFKITIAQKSLLETAGDTDITIPEGSSNSGDPQSVSAGQQATELKTLKADIAKDLKEWQTDKYCEPTDTEPADFDAAAASDLKKQQHFIATGHVTEEYSKLTPEQKKTLGNEIKTTYNAGKDSFRNGLWKKMTEEKITAKFSGAEVTADPKTISGDDDKVALAIAALLATTKNGQESAETKTESTETKSDPTDKTGENKDGDKKDEVCKATKEGKCDKTKCD
uniref:Variant surface glycoprotein n=1 Tax=Trypanosoma brucei TaxID=5691 RepID=A0A1V0FZ83_9TRYP|nr:variant surface glycoprotein [Trypanosoma brucei]